MTTPIEPPDSVHLRAAEGWLGLGNHIEADVELDKITLELRTHPDVLEVRWEIYARAKRWEACVDIADAIIKLDTNRAGAWIHRSVALHESNRTQEALDQLLPVADKFPGVWKVPYDLSCYCAQLERLDEAKEWFKKAMLIDESAVQRIAIDDSDLQPLWDSMSGSLWKRA
jgi:tetratricopeptide (TPR) repeat protein